MLLVPLAEISAAVSPSVDIVPVTPPDTVPSTEIEAVLPTGDVCAGERAGVGVPENAGVGVLPKAGVGVLANAGVASIVVASGARPSPSREPGSGTPLVTVPDGADWASAPLATRVEPSRTIAAISAGEIWPTRATGLRFVRPRYRMAVLLDLVLACAAPRRVPRARVSAFTAGAGGVVFSPMRQSGPKFRADQACLSNAAGGYAPSLTLSHFVGAGIRGARSNLRVSL
jgi:hypothetical protein